jgi:hypothetical protein
MKKIFFGLIPLIIFITGCDNGVTADTGYAIGDTGPGGGLVFYDKGSVSDGWRYLECASADLGRFAWASEDHKNTSIPGAAYSIGIGDGKTNTIAILNFDSNAPAAKACVEYSSNGKTDWFLPSLGELIAMYTNLSAQGKGNFETLRLDGLGNASYWSSSQHDVYPWFWTPSDGGNMGDNHTDKEIFVRPIRAF